jgi:DNA-binding NtrC family response regulator
VAPEGRRRRQEPTRDDHGPRPDDAGPALLLIAGEGTLATHALARPELVIGRGEDCDIVVASPTLSRRHARLRLGPQLTVQDLGSHNGTRIAGELRKSGEPVALAVGDAFHIGRYSFVVLSGSSAAAASVRSDAGRSLRIEDPTVEGATPLVHDIARSSVHVLILGETGVGKELLAETLHRLSQRTGPLVRINCAALSPTLLESELFGYDKGAFTGATQHKPGLLESAKHGTVLLDEVGELPAPLQAKLLRVLETKEVLRVGAVRPLAIDVRFLAATNRDLPAEAARGLFRPDLFFRLDGVTLTIPPLRERRRAIAPLALRFVEAARRRGAPARLATDTLRQIEAYDWPGNVRELKTTIERALLLAPGGELRPSHLGLRIAAAPPPPAPPSAPAAGEGDVTAAFSPDEQRERARLIEALEACAGNQTRAAQRLGISRATMVTRLAIYRVPRPRK